MERNSPLAHYKQSIQDHDAITKRVQASFGETLFIEPAKYGKVELQQGDDDGGRNVITLNDREIEWVAQQFARLIGKTIS